MNGITVPEDTRPVFQIDREKAHTVYKNEAGKRVPSVTTVLGIVGKDALIFWAWKQGCEGKDFRKVSAEACDIGTIAHGMCHAHLMGMRFDASNLPGPQVKIAENSFLKFLSWWDSQGLEVLESELVMVSERWQVGGTLDIVAKRKSDGKIIIPDLKTSNGIYREMKIQVCAYAELYREHTAVVDQETGVKVADGVKADETWIVRLGKEESGDFEAVQIFNRDECVAAFEALVPTYRALQKVK